MNLEIEKLMKIKDKNLIAQLYMNGEIHHTTLIIFSNAYQLWKEDYMHGNLDEFYKLSVCKKRYYLEMAMRKDHAYRLSYINS